MVCTSDKIQTSLWLEWTTRILTQEKMSGDVDIRKSNSSTLGER